MAFPEINYVAVLVAGVVIFALGGLWYSLLFARPWMAAMRRTEEELRAQAAQSSMAITYILVFLSGLITAWVLAVIVTMFSANGAIAGAITGALCWVGFAGATSFGTALFSFQPRQLWLINTVYNLVSFVIAGMILAVWR